VSEQARERKKERKKKESSFVRVQRERKFNRQQVPASSTVRWLVQKFELTGSVCNNKKVLVERHRSACMQDNIAHVCEVLLQSLRKSVTQYSQLLGIKRSTHTPSCKWI
jgi:orotate phosphoribosyltransferase-like protein